MSRAIYVMTGAIPMRCDGQHDGVYQFELRLVEIGRGIVIGIDQGRTNKSCAFWRRPSNHYGLYCDGDFYKKGTFRHSLPPEVTM